jgi:hypothetical protein
VCQAGFKAIKWVIDFQVMNAWEAGLLNPGGTLKRIKWTMLIIEYEKPQSRLKKQTLGQSRGEDSSGRLKCSDNCQALNA